MLDTAKKVDIKVPNDYTKKEWKFQKSYFILFWILFLLEISSIWMLILQLEFLFLDNELL